MVDGDIRIGPLPINHQPSTINHPDLVGVHVRFQFRKEEQVPRRTKERLIASAPMLWLRWGGKRFCGGGDSLGSILWSDQASRVLRVLDPDARDSIRKRTAYLRTMPRMYAMASSKDFPGCRRFWAEPACYVYYMVGAGGDDCYIVAIEVEEPADVP
jgi:hypothetical protein